MDWLRQLGRAIRNLARISRQNPIWAITALTLSPIALIRHLFRVAILFLIVGIVLAGGMQFVLRSLLGFAHLLTIAPTRTGKGVGTIIPNLIDYPGSVVCIDPKGENARVTARQRRRFGPVNVLDPFGVTGLPSAAFNPLDRIDPVGLDLADDAMTLADALVYDAPGEAGEAHWNEEAKALIAGLILHIVASEPPATRTLATLRDHLTLAPAAFIALLEAMQGSGGLVARAANRHLGKSDREALACCRPRSAIPIFSIARA